MSPQQPGRYPPWLVLHVPHDSIDVPAEVRGNFLLNDGELLAELTRMTDHHTMALFAQPKSQAVVVRAPVSRLVVDVERFQDDAQEPMAARGMGAVYTVTSHLKPLRRPLSTSERGSLIQAYYRPHHARLEAAVSEVMEQQGRCLVIDCHSFPATALPYELADSAVARPDICIGTDAFHTSPELASAFVTAFQREGWSVSLNEPFTGALVPISRYQRDSRVSALMVEVNRRLYLRESDGASLPEFDDVARKVRRCLEDALSAM
jgi:N-formylglutamate amidohydrolase